jgi:hypothetical protein
LPLNEEGSLSSILGRSFNNKYGHFLYGGSCF